MAGGRLARWVRDGKPVSAGEFVPFAEQSGQIIPLGRIVIRQAQREMPGTWLVGRSSGPLRERQPVGEGTTDVPLVDELIGGLSPHTSTGSEVTESLEPQESSRPSASGTVVPKGVRIAIDDFGRRVLQLTRFARAPAALIDPRSTAVWRVRAARRRAGVAFLTAATEWRRP